MYQFGLTTTRSCTSFVGDSESGRTRTRDIAGRRSTMSLTSGTNKWASRAVVALQLAAWSAVGIVLLEKGVTSLRRSNNLANDYSSGNNSSQQQITSTKWEDALVPLLSVDGRIDETARTDEIGEDSWQKISAVNDDTSTQQDVTVTLRRDIKMNNGQMDDEANGERSNTSRKNGQNGRRNEFETNNNKDIRHGDRKSLYDSTTVEVEKTLSLTTTGIADHGRDEKKFEEEATMKSMERPAMEITEDASGASTNRKRHGFAHRSNNFGGIGAGNGGAAAAIAMIAVGAIMLILGPAVIVLRALDERRQERRFQKLSVHDDLPPSYEQATATIGEQAPTYSSLNLDTILSSGNNSACSSSSR